MNGGTRRRVTMVAAAVVLIGVGCSDDSATPRRGAPTVFVDDTHGTTLRIVSPMRVVKRVFTVQRAALAAPGYVAVYADADGALGDRIGQSKMLPKGASENVRIKLSTSPTGYVWVVAHREQNGNGKLDYPAGDQPFSGTNGVLAAKVDISSSVPTTTPATAVPFEQITTTTG